MKLGIIDYVRCGEPEFMRTLVWLPDEMTPEQFEATIEEAKKEYLAFAEAFKNEPAPNGYREYSTPPYEKHPSLTVAEVRRIHAENKAAWDAWNAERQKARKTFASYLVGRNGIEAFYEHLPEAFTVECDWGHRHGWKLDYGETKYDDV
jgi:hypothetical protein